MARHKNSQWSVSEKPDMCGAILTVLMDLRDELQAIRRLAECPNVQAGFIAMQKIEHNTRKKKRNPVNAKAGS